MTLRLNAFGIHILGIIFTEESFLLEKFGDKYLEYTKQVNCILPSFKKFRKPDRKFSVKMVLKREHDTWLTTALSLVFVELLREYGHSGRITLHPLWIFIVLTVGIVWTVLKYMKKFNRLVLKENL